MTLKLRTGFQTTALMRQIRRLKYGRPHAKVFCVGLQKTGPTSLGYALHLLGYRVAGSTQIDRSPPLDTLRDRALAMTRDYDAFQDMPWALFFRNFDLVYPDAKFILTLREPEDWYRSMCKHFPTELSRLGKVVYGTERAEDKDVLIRRYEDHVAEVRSHFFGRSGKLLEIDLGADDGWDPLCAFLDVQRPNRPFPWLNRNI